MGHYALLHAGDLPQMLLCSIFEASITFSYLESELQIRRSNGDNLDLISHISL